MGIESRSFYEVLGIKPGASAEEAKAAYRDLAKVWHPDRFASDPRLQQKAQERLKEINEAYSQFISGKPASLRRSTEHQAQSAKTRRPIKRRFGAVLLCLALFGGMFGASIYVLHYRNVPSTTGESKTPANPSSAETSASNGASDRSLVEKHRSKVEAKEEEPSGISATVMQELDSESDPPVESPPSTVALTVDPSTNLIATLNCPQRVRMTFVSGSEPHGYCALHQKDEMAADSSKKKESRLTSFAKRVASPTKWLKDERAQNSSSK
jgi:hypothetical protein